MSKIILRTLKSSDIPMIVDGFKDSNWIEKRSSTFEQYLDEQNNHKRLIWIALTENQFAGYVTLTWASEYIPFQEQKIPEIMDLNVLPKFRNKGIAKLLLDKAESEAALKSNTVGIGVGLYSDYGSAQRIYVQRGYIPDGEGITYNYQTAIPGKNYRLDDDLILWFTKKII